MRIIKWLFGGLFLVFLLLGLAFAYLATTFDPNEHKQSIVDLVKERTGRVIEINGEMDMSFYPWLSLSMADTRLSNAEGFKAAQFAQFEQASVRLQLMPLLQKKIVADRIELSGAEVWLERNKEGISNWDDVIDKLTSTTDTAAENTATSDKTPLSGNIAGLSIKDSDVHWDDQSTGTALTVTNFNLDTGELALDQETNIDTDFQFDLKDPVIQGQAKLVARTTLSRKAPYQLKQPNLELNLQGIDLQAQNVQANIVADVLSFADGKIDISQPNVVYEIANMPSLGEQAKGTLQGEALSISEGVINLTQFNLGAAIQGSALPGETADANLASDTLSLMNNQLKLNNVKLSSAFTGEPWPQGQQEISAEFPQVDFNMSNNSLSLPGFIAKVVGLNLSGSVEASNVTSDIVLNGKVNLAEFSPKEVAKRLAIDLPEMSDEAWQQTTLKADYTATKNTLKLTQMTANIDGVAWTGSAAVDDLNEKVLSFNLSAPSLDVNRLIPPEQADALKDNESAKSDDAVNNIVIPTEPLRLWDVNGQVSLGQFTFGNMVSTNLKAKIDLLDGLLKVSPTNMQVFGGTETGNWTLDARSDVPKLTGQERFQEMDLSKIGQAMWQQQYMTGTITGQISVDTQGKTIGEMRAGLNGNLDVKVTDGVLQGIDVNHALANAVSLFRDKTLSAETNTEQTAFSQLSATGTIESGVLRNEDFLAVMPRIRTRGKGSFSFVDTTINYFIDADVLESKSAQIDPSIDVSLDELVGATIPIKITGDLSEPSIRPDVAGFLKARFQQEIKDRARDEIQDKLKDKIGDELGGVLGGLLGGDNKEPEASTETATESDSSAKAEGQQTETQPAEDPPAEDPPAEDQQSEEVEPEDVQPEELTPEEELKQKAKDKLKDLLGG